MWLCVFVCVLPFGACVLCCVFIRYAGTGELLIVLYLFFAVSFFGLYMMNLFVGVVFDQCVSTSHSYYEAP